MFKPTYSVAEVSLQDGERIFAEKGAMTYMSSSIKIQTKMKGGIMGGLKRSVLGKESAFINIFYAEGNPGILGLAPAYQGDIEHHAISDETLFVQSGGYLASTEDIDIDIKWGGAKTFFGREGLFLLRLSGSGDILISSFGAIQKKHLDGSAPFTVDTGHVVAFTEGLDFSVKAVGGLKSTLLSGEGLVSRFEGTGDLYMQTRNVVAFARWLVPFMPKSN